MSEEQYQRYSDREKECRHIIQVRAGDNLQRLYILERGIETKVGENRWRKWSTKDVKFNIPQEEWRRDGVGWGGALNRAFVCRTCRSESNGKKVWLMKRDPGRIPSHLRPLSPLENIVFNRFVMYGRTNKMGCRTTSTGAQIESGKKLYGHQVAIPLSRVQISKSECKTIPRKKFAEYAAHICFIGSDKQWTNAARRLTFKHGIYQLRIDVLKDWMRFHGMETELQRLVDDEKGYTAAWKKEFAELEKMVVTNDGDMFHEINARASSDVAKMAPQVPDGDDATQQGATGGFQDYVGVMPMSNNTDHSVRLRWLQQKVFPKDVDDEDPDLLVTARLGKLMNEFKVNDEIIYIRVMSSAGGCRLSSTCVHPRIII